MSLLFKLHLTSALKTSVFIHQQHAQCFSKSTSNFMRNQFHADKKFSLKIIPQDFEKSKLD
tara:strand:- start:76 stop:258 length:183 start_codon:yes stop_codon:yes gene_type:complete